MSFMIFAAIVTVTTLLSCLGVLLAPGSVSEGTPTAFAFGAGLAALNAVGSMGLLAWSRSRSHAAFMRALLGGMVVRMALMLGAVAFGIMALDLPQVPLVIGLLAHFVVFLALELTIVHRDWKPAGAR